MKKIIKERERESQSEGQTNFIVLKRFDRIVFQGTLGAFLGVVGISWENFEALIVLKRGCV